MKLLEKFSFNIHRLKQYEGIRLYDIHTLEQYKLINLEKSNDKIILKCESLVYKDVVIKEYDINGIDYDDILESDNTITINDFLIHLYDKL